LLAKDTKRFNVQIHHGVQTMSVTARALPLDREDSAPTVATAVRVRNELLTPP
jgi:hypothetical protein